MPKSVDMPILIQTHKCKIIKNNIITLYHVAAAVSCVHYFSPLNYLFQSLGASVSIVTDH